LHPTPPRCPLSPYTSLFRSGRTQGGTVHFFRTSCVGSALADDSATADKRRPARLCALQLRLSNGTVNCCDIVAVDIANHIPAIAFKTARRVVPKPVLHLSINGNAVVVVKHNELGQAQRAGQRARLM